MATTRSQSTNVKGAGSIDDLDEDGAMLTELNSISSRSMCNHTVCHDSSHDHTTGNGNDGIDHHVRARTPLHDT